MKTIIQFLDRPTIACAYCFFLNETFQLWRLEPLSSWLEFVSWKAPGFKLGRVVRTTVARVAEESTTGR